MGNLQPGQTLGPYRIISQIGRGGMATVYKAYQAAMDRYVAVKVLRQVAESSKAAGRFKQEVRVIAKLEHPRILPVFDYGEQGGVIYLVMRYLEAGTLQDRMQAGPLALPEIDRLFTQLADALGYAHQQGVIHRDLKPANVMVDAAGNVFLTDFGIAKILGGEAKFTQTDAIIGTPAYISPEQAQGRGLDQRSDIYALGIVLYEMVTGRVPFSADTPLAVIMKHVTDPLPLPSTIKPDIPPAVERVLLKALARNPDERFAACADFAVAWHQALQEPGAKEYDRATLLKPAATLPEPEGRAAIAPATRKSRRWLFAAILGGGAMLTAMGCLVLGLVSLIPTLGNLLKRTPAATAALSARATEAIAPAIPTSPRGATEAMATPAPTPPEGAPGQPTQTGLPAASPGTFAAPVPINTILPQSARAISPLNAASVHQVALIDGQGGGPLLWSPDGKYLAAGTYGFDLYDGKTFEFVRSLGDRSWVSSFAFMPDGQALALTGDAGVTLWRTDTGGQVKVFPGLKDTEQLAISPDGKILAAGISQVIKLVDIASGDELATLPIGSSECNLDFSPDGKWLATAGGGGGQEVMIYDVASGNQVFSLVGHSNWIKQVVFSADGRWLASASVDQTVKVWDLTTRLLQTSLTGHTGEVDGVALSPDGKIAASISWDLTVNLWDTATGQVLNSLTGHTEWGRAVAFSPDGALVASNDNSGGVRIWGLPPEGTGAATPTPRAAGPIPTALPLAARAIAPDNVAQVKQLAVADGINPQQIVFSPDGKALLAVSYNLYFLEPGTLKTVSTVANIRGNLAYVPDGQRLAEANHEAVVFYQMPDGAKLSAIPDSSGAEYVAFSPDGALLAAVVGQSIKVWDADSGEALGTLPVGPSQGNVAFSPDGSRLVAAGGIAGMEITVWDTAAWQIVYTLQGHSSWISRLVFAPGSQILASSASDNTIRLWDLATGLLTRTIDVPQEIADRSNQVPDLAFSPDGRLLAASYGVPQFSIWEVSSGTELRRFTGPTAMVMTMAFSPDGAYLVTGDDTLRLWGLAP